MADLQHVGLGYEYHPPDSNLRITCDRLVHHTEKMTAELLVEADAGRGNWQHVYNSGRIDLLMDSHRVKFASRLAERTQSTKGSFDAMVEGLFASIVRRERQGSPFMFVGGDMPLAQRPPDTVEKLLPGAQTTLLHAAGKSGKGWLASAIAVSVETGRPLGDLSVTQTHVLNLDWEDNDHIYNARINSVAAGLGIRPPTPRYRHCTGALRHQIHEICAERDAHGIGLVVVDSGVLAAGRNEGQGAEEVAASLYDALRYLGPISIMLIHHSVSLILEGKRGKTTKAYGSQFFENLARSVWELRKNQEPGSKVNNIELHHRYANHSETYQPIGLQFDWSTRGECHVTSVDVQEDEPDSVTNRVQAALGMGESLLVSEIAVALGLGEASVRGALVHGRGKKFSMDPREQTWTAISSNGHAPVAYKEEPW